jgi:hypothetical protein
MPFLGNDSGARNIAGVIVRFTGYVITDWEYAKFRAQVMRLINMEMSNGYGGVDIIQHRLHHSFQFNETHALWLMNDLHAWGYTTRPWFLEDGNTLMGVGLFMTVGWNLPARTFWLTLPGTPFDSDDEE